MDKRVKLGPRPEKGAGFCGVCAAAMFLGHRIIQPLRGPVIIRRPRRILRNPKGAIQ